MLEKGREGAAAVCECVASGSLCHVFSYCRIYLDRYMLHMDIGHTFIEKCAQNGK